MKIKTMVVGLAALDVTAAASVIGAAQASAGSSTLVPVSGISYLAEGTIWCGGTATSQTMNW